MPQNSELFRCYSIGLYFYVGYQLSMLKGIVAMDEDRIIGNKNWMPWHYPEDLKRLKELTKDKVCVVGSKTYEWLKTIPQWEWADHFPPYTKETIIFHRNDLQNVLNRSKNEEMWVLWWAKVFEILMPYLDELYLTLIPWKHEWDAFMPEYFTDEFTYVELQDRTKDWLIFKKYSKHGKNDKEWNYLMQLKKSQRNNM